MSDPSTTRNERLRAWKKLLKPPRAVRRPLLYLALAAGLAVLGAEVVGAMRALGSGSPSKGSGHGGTGAETPR